MKDGLARAVLDRFRAADKRTRFHVRGRLLSLPFRPLLEALPEAGLIASFGCGHGAVEIAAALHRPNASVLGADIDDKKLAHARSAAHGLRAEFIHGDFFAVLGQRIEKPRCIMIVDVLYLVAKEAQVALLRRCRGSLAPGGILLIKEMDSHPRWKAFWNRFQEFLACHVLRFTRHEGGIVGLRSADDWADLLSQAGFESVKTTPLHRGYPHPHVLISGVAGSPPS